VVAFDSIRNIPILKQIVRFLNTYCVKYGTCGELRYLSTCPKDYYRRVELLYYLDFWSLVKLFFAKIQFWNRSKNRERMKIYRQKLERIMIRGVR
jgi:hypothetical protein